MRLWLICLLITGAALLAASQLLTVFIIQPIGAVPEGRTLIISRMNSMNFIDSADAWCERQMGGVNLICRMGVLGRIGSEATIYARLPYSATLYGISTGGVAYDR